MLTLHIIFLAQLLYNLAMLVCPTVRISLFTQPIVNFQDCALFYHTQMILCSSMRAWELTAWSSYWWKQDLICSQNPYKIYRERLLHRDNIKPKSWGKRLGTNTNIVQLYINMKKIKTNKCSIFIFAGVVNKLLILHICYLVIKLQS